MIRSVSALLLFAVSVAAQDLCADGTHDGAVFPVGDCEAQYYQCVSGQQHLMGCGAGTAFNPDNGICDHTLSVKACNDVDSIDCGNQAYNGQSYTKADNCETGTYYTCTNGVETETSCAAGMVFNTETGQCAWDGTINCAETSPGGNSDDPSSDTTTTTEGATPTTATITTTPTASSTTTVLDLCADGTHAGARFPVGDCEAEYYQCGSDGQQHLMSCGAGTAFNPDIGMCDHTLLVEGCTNVDSIDCDNDAYNGQSYTKADNCKSGIYYTCIDGVETETSCATDMVFYTVTRQCVQNGTINCTETSPGGNSDDSSSDTTTTTEGPTLTTTTITTTSTASSTTIALDSDDPSSDTTTTTEGPAPTTATITTTSTASSTTIVLDLCADGAHEGARFPVGDCEAEYYQCGSNGQQHLMNCSAGTAFNPDIGMCDHTLLVEGCTNVAIDCDNDAYNGQSYTKADDCESGIYYTCIDGVENKTSCAAGMVFNTKTRQCAHNGTINCKETSPGENAVTDASPLDTTTVTKGETTATPTTTSPSIVLDTDEPSPPDETTKPAFPLTTEEVATKASHTEAPTEGPDTFTTNSAITTTRDATATSTDSPIPADTDEPTPPDETTKPAFSLTTEEVATKTSHTEGQTNGPATTTEESTTAIATEAATTTATPADTYVGFVVDDTGSMSNEIVAVKDWISNCVDGSSTSCGQSPTGGWIVTSFNDPFVGRVVGPTLDTDAIIAEVGGYFAHGGGNCPELAFTGLENAVNVVPDVHSGCKIYFFTDATALDYSKSDSVTKLYEDKGCAFIPILTGCCGTCPDACESTSTEYCEAHISDSRGTTSYRLAKRSTSDSIETLFFEMSEDTGGNIYVTDKPSSPDEMLDFLEEEVTMGFCATSDIAGPSPDGYKCEDDCLAKKMCWDRSVSKCYCEGSIPCAYESVMYSMCPGEQIVVCEEDVPVKVEPDQKKCNGYYQCNFGDKYHFTCANGTVFSADVSSNCDHPENVDPPCGTRGVVM